MNKKWEHDMKKLLCLLLLCPVAFCIFAGCNSQKQPSESTLPDITSSSESVSDEKTNGPELEEILPDVTSLRKRNTDGRISLNVISNVTAVDSPGLFIGDNPYIIDEVTEQILGNVKEALGFSSIRWRSTSKADLEGYVNAAFNEVGDEGEQIDVIIGDPKTMVTLSTKGMLSPINYYDKYVDLSNSWYPENILEDTMVAGNAYFVIGDMWDDYLMSVYGYVFNKELLPKVGVDDKALYSLVREGKWTVDEMIRIFGTYYVDADGDGKPSSRDGYGVTVNAHAFFHGAGLKYYELDGEGKTQNSVNMALGLTGDRSKGLFNALSELIYVKGRVSGSSFLEEWKTVSGSHSLYTYSKLAKETDKSFGIIPIPKYDVSQRSYYSGAYDSSYAMFGIFSGNKDLVYEENAAAFIEYMGYYGKTVLHDARTREAFGDSYSAHTEDVYMLELIRRCRRIDFPTAVQSVSSSYYSGLEKGQAWEQFVNTFNNQSRPLADNAKKLSSKYNELASKFQNPYLYPYE